MRVPALWAVSVLMSVPAAASSRLVIQADSTLTVIMDNMPVSTSGGLGRYTLSSVTPGVHNLQLQDAHGQVLYQADIDISDNARASATWDGLTMTLVGAHEVSALTSEGDAAFRDADDVPEAQDTVALDAANDDEHINQLASSHGQSAPSNSYSAGGRIPYEVQQAAGGIATSAIGVPSIASDPVVTAVGSTFAYMVQNAEAGGIRKRYSPDVRQGNPNVPPPILEEVKLFNTGGQPMSVYVDGFWLHDFEVGETEKTFKIEVGRRELQFVDPSRKQLVHQGSLRIKEDYVIELEFSPTESPRARNATWAWASL